RAALATRFASLGELQQFFRLSDNVLNGEAKLFKQLFSWRRLTERGHTDDSTVQAHVFEPVVSDTRFHCHASGDRFRQYGFAVRGILLVERIGRRHGDHARFHAFGSQFFPCGNGQFNFRTGRDEDQLRLACAIFQHVTTARDVCQLLWGTLLLRQVLTGEDQRGRAIMTLNAVFPRHRRFNLVTWTPCAHVRGHAQRSHLLYWLVGRTVFAQTDRVVGVDHHLTLFHQRSHTHGVTCIFHK